MYDDFDRLLEEHMKDPEFKEEYKALETEFNSIQVNIETKRAIDDVNNGRNLSKPFHSVEELMKDLNN